MSFFDHPAFFGHMVINPRDCVAAKLLNQGSVQIGMLTLSVVGATLAEAQAVADAINAAISNAKARAADHGEALAQAAE